MDSFYCRSDSGSCGCGCAVPEPPEITLLQPFPCFYFYYLLSWLPQPPVQDIAFHTLTASTLRVLSIVQVFLVLCSSWRFGVRSNWVQAVSFVLFLHPLAQRSLSPILLPPRVRRPLSAGVVDVIFEVNIRRFLWGRAIMRQRTARYDIEGSWPSLMMTIFDDVVNT